MGPRKSRPLHPTRRRILQTTGGLTALGIIGNSATIPVAADPGTEQWALLNSGP